MGQVLVDYEGGVCVVQPPERVDVSNAAHLLEVIQQEVASGHRAILVDLGRTDTLDSTALGALVQAYKWLQTGNGSLALVAVGEPVRRVLSLTRLDDVFTLYAERSEAVAAMGQNSVA
ncbi:MAG: STAS domain-containing protein [Polyangiaceae bacterium]|nr:STAS domain-containing protein [Polyangiaceae bacterium]